MENILIYQRETETIRQMPQNYCIAVKEENRWVLDYDIAADKKLVIRVCNALFEHKNRYAKGLELLAAITPNKEFKSSRFIVGKSYRYSEIINENEDVSLNDYGEEYLGQNAIHIRYNKSEIDVWFIWESMANEGILKCVYNN